MPICQKIDRLEAIEANLIVAKGDDMHIVDLEQSRHCLRQHLAADVHRTKTGIRQVGFDSQPQIARRANICRVERNNNTPKHLQTVGFRQADNGPQPPRRQVSMFDRSSSFS